MEVNKTYRWTPPEKPQMNPGKIRKYIIAALVTILLISAVSTWRLSNARTID